MEHNSDKSAIAEVEAAELRRCQAISTDDADTIAELLADEVWYQHSNGFVDDKAGFLSGLTKRVRTVRRDPLDIRIYGDTAVVIGAYHITSASRHDDSTPPRQIHAQGLQTWVKRGGRWQLVAHQGLPQHETTSAGQ